MKTYLTYRNWAAILLCALLLVGCKGHKQVSETLSTIDGDAIQSVIDHPTTKEDVQIPHYLQANFTCEVSGVKVRCQARMCSDSIIWVNVNKIVDLGRAILTPDSVAVYVGFNNSYYKCDYQYLENKFGVSVDYPTLQRLLVENTEQPNSLVVPIRSSQLNADANVMFDSATKPTKLTFPFSIPKNAQKMSMSMFN